jgi:hypothetical protein
MRIPPALCALVLAACGSSTITSSRPPLVLPPGPYVIRLVPQGVEPQVLHVWQGRSFSVVNDDVRPRVVQADPHPAHDECGGLLNFGALRPGERREVDEAPFGGCFFHDEDEPTRLALQGAVIIH